MGEKTEFIAGVGFVWFDKCLEYAQNITECAATVTGTKSYFIYKAFDQKTYSDQRITKDLVVITYDSKSGEIARVELDNALKEINTLGSGKSDDSYIKSVPEKVEQMASEILPEYGYSLPAMELQIVLCGTV